VDRRIEVDVLVILKVWCVLRMSVTLVLACVCERA